MDNKKARIIERVRKLLAKAADASSPEEAATAARMVESTMRKYQLAHSDVTIEDQRSGATVEDFQMNRKAAPVWVRTLASAVAFLHEVYNIRIGGTGKIRFVGTDVDVMVAIETMKYLTTAINRLTKLHGGDKHESNSFRLGAVEVISYRLRELARERRAEFQQSGSTALVECKQALVEKWKEDCGMKIKNGSRPKSRINGDAYAAGRRAGQSIGLNEQLNGGNSHQQIR